MFEGEKEKRQGLRSFQMSSKERFFLWSLFFPFASSSGQVFCFLRLIQQTKIKRTATIQTYVYILSSFSCSFLFGRKERNDQQTQRQEKIEERRKQTALCIRGCRGMGCVCREAVQRRREVGKESCKSCEAIRRPEAKEKAMIRIDESKERMKKREEEREEDRQRGHSDRCDQCHR